MSRDPNVGQKDVSDTKFELLSGQDDREMLLVSELNMTVLDEALNHSSQEVNGGHSM